MKFWLTGEITEENVNAMIRDIDGCSAKRIIIYINSTGGDYEAARFLHGYLSHLSKEVVTAVVGDCWSSAVLILVAGAERWSTDVGKIMIHQIYDSGVDSELIDLMKDETADLGVKEYQRIIDICQANIADCLKYTDEYFRFISKNSNLTVKKIKLSVESAKEGDWFITPKDGLRCHLVDNIGLPDESGAATLSVVKNGH